jgi:hypothetical protein
MNNNKHQIKLKSGVLEELIHEKHPSIDGVTMWFVLADLTGMSYTQIYRIRTGKCKVGTDFIASILAKNPHKNFEDLFFVQ